jgi:hypothetical protein
MQRALNRLALSEPARHRGRLPARWQRNGVFGKGRPHIGLGQIVVLERKRRTALADKARAREQPPCYPRNAVLNKFGPV